MKPHIYNSGGLLTRYRFICFVAAALVFMALSGGALAANFSVINTDDAGLGSLR